MIHAVFERKNGRLCGVTIQGHAGYARAGKDIVCAAVSSALQYATILITESFHEQDEESEHDGFASVRLKNPDKGQAFLVLDGLHQHLGFLAEDFPGTIEIEITEV